MLPLYLVKSR